LSTSSGHEHYTSLQRVKVLVIDPVSTTLINGLKELGLEVVYRPGISRDEVAAILPDFDILILRGRLRIDEELLRRGEKLKIIARAGTGLDNINVAKARERGIKVISAEGASTESVAELTICLMIAAARKIASVITNVREGKWIKEVGIELFGKVLGIVGLGRIGSRVAEIAKVLGMRVIAYDVANVREKAEKLGVEIVSSLHELLRRSDVVSLHVPLKEDTYHMISRQEFEVLKRGAIIVNTARGALIDTRELLRALNEWVVYAAGLDTLENEPPKYPWEFDLIKHPRVVITAHVGAQTYEAQERIALELIEKIRRELTSLRYLT